MRRLVFYPLLLFIHFLNAQTAPLHHELDVFIEPANNFLRVENVITLTGLGERTYVDFYLNASLRITDHSSSIRIEEASLTDLPGDFGMDRDDAGSDGSGLELRSYRVHFLGSVEPARTFKLSYEGKILSPIEQSEENYQRGFSESPGIIADPGVYLAGSTYWIPNFREFPLMSFSLKSSLPEEWKTVSQGGRTNENRVNGRQIEVWKEDKPQEEIFLVAARFTEYSYNAGNVQAMAFLRTPDEALANKYLETTAQYLEMYRQLVGPFPYAKFALVENFWETGYGMPSFTLLGEKIIRFPFILHSSYPHELLHNWWGNSVYVDFETGNWCEGITAYMADHLIKEQRGQGDEYRRTTLQKYADYVTPENDFPVAEFLSRYNASSEAIGYGKVSMIFHMLRMKLGDEPFIRAVQRFNREKAFSVASWSDIEKAFQSVTDEDLAPFFSQWVNSVGAPKLALEKVDYSGKEVELTIVQQQADPAFTLQLPVLLLTDAGYELESVLLNRRTEIIRLRSDHAIHGVQLDPKFDVFRVLHPDEVPASFSKAYGAKSTLFVLPAEAIPERMRWYAQFIEQWKQGNKGDFELIPDDQLNGIPEDRTVWILDYDNAYVGDFFSSLAQQDVSLSGTGLTLKTQEITKHEHSTFITAKHPENKDEALVFLSIEKETAIPGLVRKLPHYGKYSYLAFVGDEPTNTIKGQWTMVSSPLVSSLGGQRSQDVQHALGEPAEQFLNRRALAYLAPVFSSDRIMEDIGFLASPEMKGRGIGTSELDQAAEYIAREFEQAGLMPGGDNGTYFQGWTHEFDKIGPTALQNVIGVIPGTDPEFANEPVVLSAHYDHLGLGWPDVRAGNEGMVHYGADDNASGVAVMLELARNMVKNAKPVRPVYFIAFTAEEAGLVGARHFIHEFIKGKEGNKPFANLNLDTNGRLFDKPLLVLNGNTAREWKFIFMGTEYVTGVKTELVQQPLDASDQVAFNEKGIPAVQLFSGPHTDYHRPGDTPDKLDPAGMVKVAMVAKEVIQYLSDRTDPMPYTGEIPATEPEETSNPGQAPNRRAATGSMPDFSYSGPGVKIASVSEGSPGAAAGLKSGDIITSFAGERVDNLREYSNVLKTKVPGDVVELQILRGEETLRLELVLGER